MRLMVKRIALLLFGTSVRAATQTPTLTSTTLAPGQTITAGGVLDATDWLCWASAKSSVTALAASCSTAGAGTPTITTAGSGGVDTPACGAAGIQNVAWIDVVETKIAAMACRANATAPNTTSSTLATITTAATSSATPQLPATLTLSAGGTITAGGALASADWLCWSSGTAAPITATCGAVGTASASIATMTATTPSCGAAGEQTATWDDAAQIAVAAVACTSAGAASGTASSVNTSVITKAGSTTPTLVGGSLQVGGTLTAGGALVPEDWLCWRAGTSSAAANVSVVATCGAVGTGSASIAADAQSTPACGAPSLRTATWEDATLVKIAAIACSTGGATTSSSPASLFSAAAPPSPQTVSGDTEEGGVIIAIFVALALAGALALAIAAIVALAALVHIRHYLIEHPSSMFDEVDRKEDQARVPSESTVHQTKALARPASTFFLELKPPPSVLEEPQAPTPTPTPTPTPAPTPALAVEPARRPSMGIEMHTNSVSLNPAQAAAQEEHRKSIRLVQPLSTCL